MSVEKPSATETPAFDALLANAEAAAAKAAANSVEAPKIEPMPTSASQNESPAEAARSAPLMIFEPAAAASREKQRSGIFHHVPLAASLALAAAFGSLTGAAAVHLARDASAAPPATEPRVAEATQPLHDKLAELGAEITTLKTSMSVVQRNTGLQSGKLGERLERIEKGQAEPAARLAKLAEAVDRLERRPPPSPAAAASQQSADVTGSIPTEAKPETKLSYADGWRLRDYYAGRAVVENQNGRFFEIGPGSNLPGLGRVESIKREDGRIVVVTRNGLIAASVEQRRMPYRY